MKHSFHSAALIAVLTLPFSASALSLHDTAVKAAHYDARIAQAGANIAAAQSGLKAAEAGDNFAAGISADFGVSNLYTQARFPQPGVRLPNSIGLVASQPLYNGGRSAAEEAAAEQRVTAALEARRDIGGRVLLSALTSYLDLKRDHETLRLAEANQQALEHARDDARSLFNAGEATKTDVALADARVAEAEARSIRAAAQIRVSEVALARNLGPEEVATDAPWPQTLPLAKTREAAVALSTRAPAVVSAEAESRAASSEIARAESESRPQISLDGHVSTQDDTEFGFDRLSTWAVQLKLAMPLTTGGLTRAKVGVANARAESARYAASSEAALFAQESASEWELLQAAHGAIKAFKSQVNAAELALDGVKKEYKIGSRTTLDLLDAERELLAAQVNLVAAQRDEAVTSFRLMAACGTLELENIPD